MKKIVPFTKDLMFKTKIGEITSIALDNTLKLDDDTISGEFIVSGTYKMLESSQIEEEFKYNIPALITIDSKYETKNCIISIDDFSYEIINEEKLKVNISVMLDDLDIKEDPIESLEVVLSKEEDDRNDADFGFLDDALELEEMVLEAKKEIEENKMFQKQEVNMSFEKEKVEIKDNLFENMTDTKEFSIYRVYTVGEDDTMELIYEKFNTNKEILADYNDLDNVRVGTKLIIPSQDE